VNDYASEYFRNYPSKEADSGNTIVCRSRNCPLKEADNGDTIVYRFRSSYSKEADGDIIILSHSRSVLLKKAENALVMDLINVNTMEVTSSKALMRARTDYLG
jgi:hypothetical protein